MPTRRSLLRTMAALPAAKFAAGAAQKKATAFALVGDRYHNSDYIRTALTKTLVKDLGITTDLRTKSASSTPGIWRATGYSSCFRDGMIWPDGYPEERAPASEPPVPKREAKDVPWITPAQGKAVKDFVSKGGSALFYHNVTYISPNNQDFRDVLGAVTHGHPPSRPYKVKVVNNTHPITRGVNDFVVGDEQHFLTYDKDPKNVLLRSVNEKGLTYQTYGDTCEAGWAFDYGKGRVCYLAPGHTNQCSVESGIREASEERRALAVAAKNGIRVTVIGKTCCQGSALANRESDARKRGSSRPTVRLEVRDP